MPLRLAEVPRLDPHAEEAEARLPGREEDPRVIRSLLAGAIDYAGLFPPAALPMAEAARNFAAYRAGPDAWALGRFVVPTSRLAELEGVHPLEPDVDSAGPWRISALISGDGAADLATIAGFNERHAESAGAAWPAVVELVEARADDPGAAEALAFRLPRGITGFVEVPVDADPAPILDVLARRGLNAKIRTGGVTPAQFPTPAQVARFLVACAQRDLPFKATAGLHHPLRAEYPLTYEPGSARGTMYGFLNVFLAATAARQGAPEGELVALLEERDRFAIRVGPVSFTWRDRVFPAADVASMRGRFGLSFGSCSFDEPLADLRSLALL